VESAREGAGGYSFPSGHTQNSVGMLGSLGVCTKRTWIKALCIAGVILVPLSRMYLGVHTPQDVLVSMAIAFVLIVSFDLLLRLNEKHPCVIYITMGCMLALTVSFLIYLYVYPFPADVFAEENVANYNSALKNAYTMLGCILGMLVFRIVDDKVTHYDTSAVWWAQLLKFALGVGIVMLVKEGAKPLLNAIFGGHMAAHAVRYFLVVIAATAWTFTFKFWKKLGQK
jgi:undecaprenyl-diphosphatase